MKNREEKEEKCYADEIMIINYKVNELTARTVPFCMSEVALDRRPDRLLINALPFVLINYI